MYIYIYVYRKLISNRKIETSRRLHFSVYRTPAASSSAISSIHARSPEIVTESDLERAETAIVLSIQVLANNWTASFRAFMGNLNVHERRERAECAKNPSDFAANIWYRRNIKSKEGFFFNSNVSLLTTLNCKVLQNRENAENVQKHRKYRK